MSKPSPPPASQKSTRGPEPRRESPAAARAFAQPQHRRRPRRIANREEQSLQIACIDLARRAVAGIVIFHVPNEGKRGKVEGAMMKRAGMTKGVGDLVMITRQGGFGMVELKKPGDIPTREQFAYGAAVEDQGGLWAWCDTIEGFERILRDWCGNDRVKATVLPSGATRAIVRK